jgi:hypothetical protein
LYITHLCSKAQPIFQFSAHHIASSHSEHLSWRLVSFQTIHLVLQGTILSQKIAVDEVHVRATSHPTQIFCTLQKLVQLGARKVETLNLYA